MSTRIPAALTMYIEIYDKDALRAAAAARAAEEGIGAEDWEEIRRGHGDDLRMLLDPGSIPNAGFEIIDSTCDD